MIAGALAAMAAVLTLGREDWQVRLPYFAMFGALGWSFGGSMSYMMVVGYTHSGDSISVLYGFACLFLIGFLWAAPGGAGTALAALADRDRLTELFAPLSAVFVAWFLQRVALVPWLIERGYDLNWYDTDWLAATTAPAAVMVLAAIRRRLDRGSGLVLAMSAGWWAGFGLMVVALGFRMTPPRGDNWAGCLGLTLAIFAYCLWTNLPGVVLGGLIAGIVGGISFASACMLKLVEVTSGYETNWHSIMEQTTGLIHGLGIAAALIFLARRADPVSDTPRIRRWTEVYAVAFVLLGITYLNLRKNPSSWVEHGSMPAEMAGITAVHWFDLAYLLLTIAVIIPLCVHLRRRLPLLSMSPLGQGQWLYLAFLWWMVVGNFERALVGFRPQRLVTEGVIFVNAAICTLLMLLQAGSGPTSRGERSSGYVPALRKTIVVGVVVTALTILADWGIVRAIYGDRFAGHAGLHIRFGPNATADRPGSPR
jgi:hypothetical protein